MKVQGIVGFVLAAVFCTCSASASSSIDEAEGSDALVAFLAKRGDKAFTITCRPRTDEIGRSSDWVEHCNQLGRAAIDAATKDGLISHVDGAAFGMAAQFARALPANASAAARSMSRDFPLVVTASDDSESGFPSTPDI